MCRALLDHMAEFDNSKALIDQQQPSGLTKEILQPHIHFKLKINDNDDENEASLFRSTMPNPSDEWISQSSNSKVMEKLAGDWGVKSTKAAD